MAKGKKKTNTKNNPNQKKTFSNQSLVSKKLVTRNCDEKIYNEMKSYIKRILVEKNHYAKVLEDDVYTKFRIIHGLGKHGFSTEYAKVKLIDKNCPKTDLQSAREDVCTKFSNQVNQIEFKFVLTYENEKYYELKKEGKLYKYHRMKPYSNICKETDLENLLSYICDQFLYSSTELKTLVELPNKNLFVNLFMFYESDNSKNSIKNYIFSRDTKTYLKWQRLINKYSYERLLTLALRKFLNKVKSLEINFKKPTISHKNTISSFEKHFEKTNDKDYNLLFNFNIPSKGFIQIPFKTNYFYHYKMNDLNINGTQKSTDPKYYPVGSFVQTQFAFTVKLDELKKEIQIIYAVPKNDKNSRPTTTFNKEFEIEEKKTIGIDVNTKNNIFALSDGKLFNYDKWIVDKCIQFDKERANFQRANGNVKFSKRMRARQDKLNKQSKAFLDNKVSELVKYCVEKKYNHIVMENLELKGTKSNIKGEKGLNYNRLASLLHLNDVKNVIKRIANHYGIMVSFINPKYTSKQCLVCGNIDKDNRQTQELFYCIKGDHSASNADINAACNIRNRIAFFKDKLNIKFDKDFNGFKESKYNSKAMYEGLYEDFDLSLIFDEFWTLLDAEGSRRIKNRSRILKKKKDEKDKKDKNKKVIKTSSKRKVK